MAGRTKPRVRHDSEAALAAAIAGLAEVLEQQQTTPGEPHRVAHDFIRELLADGWRPTGAYDASPPPPDRPAASPETRAAYLARMRAELDGSGS